MTDENTEPARPGNRQTYIVLGLVAAIVTAGAFAGGFFLTSGNGPSAVATDTARVVPDTISDAFPVRTCSIADALSSADLGTPMAYITNSDTGQVLYTSDNIAPVAMGSVMEVVTAVVALETLGADARLTTSVVEGSSPGSVILVGGGDPTLSVGNGTIYSGAPTLTDLAEQTVARYFDQNPDAGPIDHVIVDLSLFPIEDAWDPSWPKSDRTDGYQPLIVPLMVDGDRSSPKKVISGRSKDPAGKAVQAFIAALEKAGGTDGVNDVTVTYGSAPSNASVLATVASQPVSKLIKQMLSYEDNTLAEFLLRAASLKLDHGGTAASLQQTVVNTMSKFDIDFSGGTFVDGSGESPNNRIDPSAMAQLIHTALSDDGDMSVIRENLAIAGQSGSLAKRFGGSAKSAKGHVIGIPGRSSGVSTLAGQIESADGTKLIAIVVAQTKAKDAAKAAIDAVFAGAYGCGNNLASY